MGVEVGLAEPPKSFNPCSGGLRAADKFVYLGVNTCRAQAALSGGQRVRLFGSRRVPGAPKAAPGTILALGDDGVTIATGDGAVRCARARGDGPKAAAVEVLGALGVAAGDRLGPSDETSPV